MVQDLERTKRSAKFDSRWPEKRFSRPDGRDSTTARGGVFHPTKEKGIIRVSDDLTNALAVRLYLREDRVKQCEPVTYC